MWRLHPRTRKFEVFAEGTSNPWGIAINEDGEFFISACVIDHLWHIVQTGSYIRQGSTYKARPHPGFRAKPNAWKDDEYGLIRKTGDPDDPKLADFLTANDAWFMPVVQKIGPDGCLYILDWYDRYHCYQDANADPAGVERAKGRLYRVRYKDTPHAQPFNLATNSDDELIDLLGHPNVFFRKSVQRLLAERANRETGVALETMFLDSDLSDSVRLSALWV